MSRRTTRCTARCTTRRTAQLVVPFLLTAVALSACSQTPPVAEAAPAVAAAPAATPASSFAIQPGRPLPWTSLQSIDGQTLSLAPGPRRLLIFFATWCGDSQRAMRQLMASELAKQADLQIIGIGREEQADVLQPFARVYRLNFPLVADPDRARYKAVADSGIPQLVTVGADGVVRQVLLGEVPDAIASLHW